MEFKELTQRALDIREMYAQLEEKRAGRTWTREELAIGFVGDVGDLMKLVMAKEGIRNIPDVQNKLAHELADCLWSILVLAQEYGIDLEEAFTQTMNDLENHIESEMNT